MSHMHLEMLEYRMRIWIFMSCLTFGQASVSMKDGDHEYMNSLQK